MSKLVNFVKNNTMVDNVAILLGVIFLPIFFVEYTYLSGVVTGTTLAYLAATAEKIYRS